MLLHQTGYIRTGGQDRNSGLEGHALDMGEINNNAA